MSPPQSYHSGAWKFRKEGWEPGRGNHRPSPAQEALPLPFELSSLCVKVFNPASPGDFSPTPKSACPFVGVGKWVPEPDKLILKIVEDIFPVGVSGWNTSLSPQEPAPLNLFWPELWLTKPHSCLKLAGLEFLPVMMYTVWHRHWNFF